MLSVNKPFIHFILLLLPSSHLVAHLLLTSHCRRRRRTGGRSKLLTPTKGEEQQTHIYMHVQVYKKHYCILYLRVFIAAAVQLLSLLVGRKATATAIRRTAQRKQRANEGGQQQQLVRSLHPRIKQDPSPAAAAAAASLFICLFVAGPFLLLLTPILFVVANYNCCCVCCKLQEVAVSQQQLLQMARNSEQPERKKS
jgi:hypothetical protein